MIACFGKRYARPLILVLGILVGLSCLTSCTSPFAPRYEEYLCGVWGSSPSNILVVGYYATYDVQPAKQEYSVILHYDGLTWTRITNPGAWSVGVWGSSTSDVYVVGRFGITLHYNGAEWTRVWPIEGAVRGNDVHGSSVSDVFVAADSMTMGEGYIIHYDGKTWTEMDFQFSPYGVWCNSTSDAWIVGSGGMILHWDGSHWAESFSGTTDALLDVWGVSSDDVWAVGNAGEILHFDGTGWSEMESGINNGLTGVWAASPSDVFAVGTGGTIVHFDGHVWSTMTSGTSEYLSGLWGSSSSDVYVVGYKGTILHYDGNTWSQVDIPPATSSS